MFDLRRQMPPFSTVLTAFLCLATLATATAAPKPKKDKKDSPAATATRPRPRACPGGPAAFRAAKSRRAGSTPA